jgi:hypothetical protein
VPYDAVELCQMHTAAAPVMTAETRTRYQLAGSFLCMVMYFASTEM